MQQLTLFCAGTTPAARYAAEALASRDIHILSSPAETADVLLLDVPAFRPDGSLRNGGDAGRLLSALPGEPLILGGNLDHPALEGRKKYDLLRDEEYLAHNAAITAHCALTIAAASLKTTFADTPALVIGWGRIGKVLAKRLRSSGSRVTVAARSERDLSMLRALGYDAAPLERIDLSGQRLVINTVPKPVLSAEQLSLCPRALKMDLASVKGLLSEDVIWARGLPGLHAPESSGALIAKTVLRILKEEGK